MAQANNFGKSKTPGERASILNRGLIIGLAKAGKTVTQICEQLGCTRRTALRWIERYQDEGNVSTSPKTGAPRVITAEQKHSLVQRSLENPKMTATDNAREGGLNRVSMSTVLRRLHEAGLHHRTPASKEELTARNIQDRLAICDLHQNHTFDIWKNVIFLDEKTFQSDCNGAVHCWIRNGTRYQVPNRNMTHHQGHVNVNMFGWFSSYGVGELTKIENRFTGE